VAGMKQLRIVVADDSVIFRSSLVKLLGTFPVVKIVGEAEDGEAALNCVAELDPDLLVLDSDISSKLKHDARSRAK
jgi:DNA-binding NarL/FixJ family response regulator